jgi:large-conductance mechanosensitive channel
MTEIYILPLSECFLTDRPKFHENLNERNDVKVGSERSFGMIFAGFFVIIALLPIFTRADEGDFTSIWALVVAAIFAVIALCRPQLLKPVNKLWFQFGMLLHKMINPLILGAMFFFVVSPIGLIMRVLGKTPLKLRFDGNVESYWIRREPPGPAPETMKRQF